MFCEGDTEYNYIEKMRKHQNVHISLKPINMHGGGYSNFLDKIKTESQTNCLAKFIIVDADRLIKHHEETDGFEKLLNYCKLQNEKKTTPHFLIIKNPDFEYIACLHSPEYKGQETTRFLQTFFGFKTLEDFKKCPEVYTRLNCGDSSYNVMIQKISNRNKFIQNKYSVKKKNFEINIDRTDIDKDMLNQKCSNIEEFFNIIEW